MFLADGSARQQTRRRWGSTGNSGNCGTQQRSALGRWNDRCEMTLGNGNPRRIQEIRELGVGHAPARRSATGHAILSTGLGRAARVRTGHVVHGRHRGRATLLHAVLSGAVDRARERAIRSQIKGDHQRQSEHTTQACFVAPHRNSLQPEEYTVRRVCCQQTFGAAVPS